MRYSDDPKVNLDVSLMVHIGLWDHPWMPGGWPAMQQRRREAPTRAQIIDAIRQMYGKPAAQSVQLPIH